MQHSVTTAPESRSTLRWSAVTAGVFVTLATMALLYALGLGAGLSAFDIDTEGRLHSVGMFAGVFGAAVPLVGMLAGGFTAARAARAGTVGVGMFHGWVLWGVSAVCLVWLTGHMASATLGGMAQAAEGFAKGTSSVVASAGNLVGASGEGLKELTEQAADVAQGEFDLDLDDLLAQMNKRRAKDASPVTEAQLKQSAKALVRHVVTHDGNISEQDVRSILVAKTGITREEANDASREVHNRIAQARADMRAQKEVADKKIASLKQDAEVQAKHAANATAEQLARVSWSLFAALAASLAASLGGGAIAARTMRA